MTEERPRARIIIDLASLETHIETGNEIVEKRLGRRIGKHRTLAPIETAYLLYTGVAEAYTRDGQQVSFEEVISVYSKTNPHAWAEFEVFLDLRRRGRIVAPGPKPNTLLIKYRKNDANYRYYVLVLEEDIPIPLSKIVFFVEEARKNNWDPLLAIVDRYGDITYYMPSLFTATSKGGENSDKTTNKPRTSTWL